jgi:hypothetical protein
VEPVPAAAAGVEDGPIRGTRATDRMRQSGIRVSFFAGRNFMSTPAERGARARRRRASRARCPGSRRARAGNPFQNIDRGRSLYGEIGIDPYRVLSADELGFLTVHIEKRHVIGHNLGLADERYLQRVGHEDEGENVRILGDDVRRFAELAYRIVVSGLEESEPEFLPVRP